MPNSKPKAVKRAASRKPPAPVLVGLAGPKGVGKSTLGRYLHESFGFVPIAFADPIRQVLCLLFGWNPDQFEDRVWRETVQPDIGRSPRELMQSLGTEWGRQLVHPDLWVMLAEKRAARYLRRGQPVVFTDVRFPNEVEFLHRAGGFVMLLHRPGTGGLDRHVSEQQFDKLDVDVTYRNEAARPKAFVEDAWRELQARYHRLW